MKQSYNRLFNLVLGVHPYNTVFSFNYFNVKHILNFLSAFGSSLQRKDYVVCDIGAGNSPYYSIFQNVLSEYYAVDYKESLPKVEKRKIIQVEGVAENIPLKENFCDIVLSNQVLEHVLDAEKSIGEAFRILKPNGVIIGSVPHLSPIHLEPYDYRRYTMLGLKKELEKAGFKEVIVEGNGSVFKAVAFMVSMDILLSKYTQSRSQVFSRKRALILSPLVGALNISAIALERIFKSSERSAANLCFIAKK